MFTLNSIVPWGRSFDEYRRMFALSDGDLRGRILGCADGPASFNAEATVRGHQVVSCDPLYRFSREEIGARIRETADTVIDQTRRNAHEFVWESIGSVEELGRLRLGAMNAFLDDYDAGIREGRYVEAALPTLPFGAGTFDLAVCSHFLFLYSAHVSEDLHVAALHELCRVAREVRIFPLLALAGTRSPHVEGCRSTLEAAGLDVSVVPVGYEFQRGGNEMMRVLPRQPAWHLAQLNVARARTDLADPAMAGFVADIARVNDLAERAPGFVWRFDGDYQWRDAAGVPDPRMLVTLSVWESTEALQAFVYGGAHRASFARRAEWFERQVEASLVLWRVPAGTRPRPEMGIDRLRHLQRHGPTPTAFTFGRPFPAPAEGSPVCPS